MTVFRPVNFHLLFFVRIFRVQFLGWTFFRLALFLFSSRLMRSFVSHFFVGIFSLHAFLFWRRDFRLCIFFLVTFPLFISSSVICFVPSRYQTLDPGLVCCRRIQWIPDLVHTVFAGSCGSWNLKILDETGTGEILPNEKTRYEINARQKVPVLKGGRKFLKRKKDKKLPDEKMFLQQDTCSTKITSQ